MAEIDWLRGFLFPIINFLIFVGILVYFASKPLRQLLAGRRQEFEKQFARAKHERDVAQKALAELKAKWAQLDTEIAGMRARAASQAQHAAEQVAQEAKALAARLQQDTQLYVDAEIERARRQVARDILQQVQVQVAEHFGTMESSQQEELVLGRLAALKTVQRPS